MTVASNYQKAARRRVLKGITWLDDDRPGWLDLVEEATLSMWDAAWCVLGQVYDADGAEEGGSSGYAYVHDHTLYLDLSELGFVPASYGFNLYALNEAGVDTSIVLRETWQREIRKLRNAVD